MRSRECYLVIFAAIAFTKPLCATLCQQFSSQIYDDAKLLFSEWQSEFRSPRDYSYAVKLHDLILDDFEPKKAEAICQGVCSKREMVNHKVGVMNLTAMHIAAMMGRIDALTWLVKQGADVNACDARDFTPAHFAALDEKSAAFDYLEASDADFSAQNRFGAKPLELLKLTHLLKPASQKINIVDRFSNKIERIDGDIFCLLTGATFVEGLRQKPADVLRTWRRDETTHESVALQWVTKGIDRFKYFIHDFYLKQITARRGFERLESTDYALFSNKVFDPGDIVGVYAGEWQGGRAEGKETLVATNVKAFRGYLPFARVGFPNIVLLPFANRFGVAEGNFAIAIRAIAPGDAIYLDVPTHEIKVDTWKEPNPDALDAYLATHPLSQLKLTGRNSEDIGTLRDVALVSYISRMIPVFVRLIAEGKATVDTIQNVVTQSGLSIQAEGSEGGEPIDIFTIAAISMHLHFTNPITRRFYARKAREGDSMTLLAALRDLLGHLPPKDMTEVRLETLWQLTRTALCGAPKNAGLRTCVEFTNQQRNEL